MSNTAFGVMVSASEIEEDIMATLHRWFPTYLAEIARNLGISKNSLPQPQNYTNRNSFDAEQGEKIPKVVVLTPGLLDSPIHDGYGIYRALWRVGVGIAMGAKDEQSANMLVKAYGAAARGIVLNKVAGEAQRADIANVSWIEETYDDIPIPQQLMLYKAASLFFAVDVANVASKRGGPTAPTVEPLPAYEVVEKVFIDIETEGVSE